MTARRGVPAKACGGQQPRDQSNVNVIPTAATPELGDLGQLGHLFETVYQMGTEFNELIENAQWLISLQY